MMLERFSFLRQGESARIDLLACLLLALTSLLLYLRTMAPGLLDGDSGEWQYMANILGIPHSTGYPLYILLAKLWTLVPLGSPVWRVNFCSACCAALAVPFIYLLARRVSASRPAALIAASFFAASPSLWASATIAEVYALNTLLIVLTLFFAVRFHDSSSRRDLYLTALCFGLSLTNHRIALFIAPALLLLIWFRRRSLSTRVLVTTLLAVILPLTLYLYIPLRASQLLAEQSPANWALYPRAQSILNGKVTSYYNHTPYGFLNLVLALDNRNKLSFEDSDGQDALIDRLGDAYDLLRQQIDPFGLLLAALGLVLLWQRERRLTIILTAAGATVALVALVLRAESTRFYFSATYLVLILFFAVACGQILAELAGRRGFQLSAFVFLALFPLTALLGNFGGMDRSRDTRYDEYARAVLGDNISRDAVLIAPWEVATPIRYLQFVEGQRPDVLVIHESPVRPQFQKLMVSAHTLGRPFYYALFSPEDKHAPGPRSVQAVALPLPSPPQPQHPLDVPLTDSVRVIGYDWTPDPARPGEFARLSFYYHVTAKFEQDYIASLDLVNIRGEPVASWERRPVTEYYPTYWWKKGEFFRDVWDVPIAVDLPKGLYSARLTWRVFDPARAQGEASDSPALTVIPLRVGSFDSGQPQYAQLTPFANDITLLGYSLAGSTSGDSAQSPTVTVSRGQNLTLSLFWQAERRTGENYTFFAHLLDEQGNMVAQSDHLAWNGLFPTDRWQPGQVVRDDFELDLANAPLDPGSRYRLRVGMYLDPVHPISQADSAALPGVMLNALVTAQ